MKFKLSNGCKTIQTENELLIANEIQKSEISLNISMFEFERILNGEVLVELLENLYNKDNEESLEKLKDYNSLIYILMEQKLIEPISEYESSNRKVWLKSCLIELTDCCNFRCPHCYVDKKHFNKLSLSTIKDLAEELLALNCNKITLTGGEVLTHSEFVKIYEYLYKKGFILGINSNGSLIDDEILAMFKKMPPYVIEISLYGYDKCSYEDFTKTDSFDKVLNNIQKLKDKNINVILKNVITNSNKAHFSKIRELANKLGVEFRSDYISFPQINGEFKQNPEQISVEDAINSLKNQPRAKEYFINLYNNYEKDDGKVFKCKRQDDSIFISSKLDVCMCICMQSYAFKYEKGNLLDIILKHQDFRQMEFSKASKCYDCRFMPICRYCPAKFYLTTGDYQKAPQWFCDYAQQIYNTFIKGFSIIRKKYLSTKSFDVLFEIVKENMSKIGFNPTENDKILWIENIKKELNNDNFYFYVIFFDGEICGLVELLNSDNKFIISEIQFNSNVRGSKLIVRVIDFLLNNPSFKDYNKAFFNINKNNLISNKTFTHLGAKIVEEKEKSFKYEIERKTVETYIQNLSRLSKRG